MDGAKAKKEIKIKKMEDDAIKKMSCIMLHFYGARRGRYSGTHTCVCVGNVKCRPDNKLGCCSRHRAKHHAQSVTSPLHGGLYHRFRPREQLAAVDDERIL